MKKISIFVFLFTVVYGFVFAQNESQIYIFGNSYNGEAVYWNNGRWIELSKTSNIGARVNGIAISGTNIYFVGRDGNDAVYWLNGNRNILPRTQGRAEAKAIAISGSNIYIIGNNGNNSGYWLNNNWNTLTNRANEVDAITISGSNVYIAGTEGKNLVYWVNGRKVVIPTELGVNSDPLITANLYPFVKSIAVSGSDIYILGYEGFQGHIEGVYWLNGRRNRLDGNAITIFNSNIYIVGEVNRELIHDDGYVQTYPEAFLWQNGNQTILPRNNDWSTAVAITVSNSNIYIVGTDGVENVYWVNGRQVILPRMNNNIIISGIGIRN